MRSQPRTRRGKFAHLAVFTLIALLLSIIPTNWLAAARGVDSRLLSRLSRDTLTWGAIVLPEEGMTRFPLDKGVAVHIEVSPPSDGANGNVYIDIEVTAPGAPTRTLNCVKLPEQQLSCDALIAPPVGGGFEKTATPAVALTVIVPPNVLPPGFVAIATLTLPLKLVTVLP